MTEHEHRSSTPRELTHAQRQLLETAVERGYFEVPRRTTLVELADTEEMQDVETSETLRQSLDVVVRTYLDEGGTHGNEDTRQAGPPNG